MPAFTSEISDPHPWHVSATARLTGRWIAVGTALLAYGALSARLIADVAAGINDSKLNVFILAAAIASVFLLAKASSERMRGGLDPVAAIFVLAGIVAGHAAAAASLFGLFLLLTGRRGSYRAAGGVVMMAVCCRIAWAPLILKAIAPVILPADAALTSYVLAWQNPAVSVVGTIVMTSPDFGIDIQEACSSFHNVSLAFLAVCTVAMLSRRRFVVYDLTVLAMTAAVQIALNVVRLSLMAPGQTAFEFWHDGPGKQGMAALATFLTIAMAVLGVSWASRRATARSDGASACASSTPRPRR